MIRYAFVLCLLAAPAFAQTSKQANCDHQAQVVAAILIITPWVYEQKMRDVRNRHLGEAWKELGLRHGG